MPRMNGQATANAPASGPINPIARPNRLQLRAMMPARFSRASMRDRECILGTEFKSFVGSDVDWTSLRGAVYGGAIRADRMEASHRHHSISVAVQKSLVHQFDRGRWGQFEFGLPGCIDRIGWGRRL